MDATPVAADLAKYVLQLAVADEHWRVVETQRLTRTQLERWFANRDVGLVIMETCGSAHHWACWLNGLGIEVKLLRADVSPRLRHRIRRRHVAPRPGGTATDLPGKIAASTLSDPLFAGQVGASPPSLQRACRLQPHFWNRCVLRL